MSKISIIIPTYNNVQYISKAIDSLLRQTFSDFDIVIINDGSTDGTKNTVMQYVEKYHSKIRYFSEKNKGPGAARNRGIKEARGEYISFLDSDDYYEPRSLQLRMDALKQYQTDIVIGKRKKMANTQSLGLVDNSFLQTYSKAVLQRSGQIYLCDSNCFFRQAINKGFFVDTNSIMFKKEFLKKIGMFDEKQLLSEDIDLWFRAFLYAKEFVFVDDVLSVTRKDFSEHARDLKKLFFYERRRFIKHIKILNENRCNRILIKVLKKKICAKKYKIKGIFEYREGSRKKALKYYIRSLCIYKDDEILTLLCKALIPKIATYRLKHIRAALIGAR